MAKLRKLKNGEIPIFVTAKTFSEITGKSLSEVKRLCNTKEFPAEYKGSYYQIHYVKAMAYLERSKPKNTRKNETLFNAPRTASEMKAILLV